MTQYLQFSKNPTFSNTNTPFPWT